LTIDCREKINTKGGLRWQVYASRPIRPTAAEAAKPVSGEVDSDEAPEAPVEETKKVFFSIVDRQALRRGDFTSVTDFTAAIGWFCRSWNEHCSPLPGPSPPTRSSPSCTVKPPSDGVLGISAQ